MIPQLTVDRDVVTTGSDRVIRDALAVVRAEATGSETIGLLGELIDAFDLWRTQESAAAFASRLVAESLERSLEHLAHE